MTHKLNNKQLDQALALLHSGRLVAVPTETVYGLAGDASNPKAIQRIFDIKDRPSTRALSALIAKPEDMSAWARDIPDTALSLANAFWPGPLTLILNKQPHVLDALTAGQDTVGLRIPDHPMTLQLITAFGNGLACPSANTFSHPSPTTTDQVQADLGNSIDFIIDGGACRDGMESTIVDCTTQPPKILRQGFIAEEEIFKILTACS